MSCKGSKKKKIWLAFFVTAMVSFYIGKTYATETESIPHGLTKSMSDKFNVDTFIEQNTAQKRIPPLQDINKIKEDFKGSSIKNIDSIIGKAMENDPDSQRRIGQFYLMAFQDEKAEPWLFAAAREENAEAYYLLALMHYRQSSPSYNIKIADNLMKKAAELGSVDAMYYMS